MIRDRVGRGWYCVKCSGNHPSHMCQAAHEASDLPLETPSHNGEYVGPAQVRELPFGVSGTEGVKIMLPKYRVRAGEVSHRLAVANRLNCAHCGKRVPKNSKSHKYCSTRCQRDKAYERQKEKRLENAKTRKSRWA